MLGALLASLLSACLKKADTSDDSNSNDTDTSTWPLTSPDFTGGEAMPYAFTCNGGDFASGENPELDWSGGPSAQSYALVLKDISITARMDPATVSHGYHWAIWNIPAATQQIPHGLSDDEFPPEVEGARQWAIRDQFGYFPPCPNSDPTADPTTLATDHYAFTLYAIPTATIADPQPDPNEPNYTRTLDDYLKTIAVGETELLFTSDAASSAPPPALDPSSIEPPSD